ncbi:hypothetical protein M2103_000618 [Ereboglobus sp. PH5-5]|uniref:AIPR family protein n=1 Tax=Ereboglobus sp. PH5-5 TaxID=2940529 RepID=UPI002406AA91|nr:AIPR family protein [Ereboglobus sp. PH5-5]MDF9832408.1 hypothetical protein [Ereboglobus sp. PH5-5]
MTIEEYYEDFKQNLSAEAGTAGEMLANAFIEKICGIIAEQGDMADAEQVNYKFTQLQRGIAVDAWARDSERGHLTLLIADFRNAATIETITNRDIEKTLKRLDRFVEACTKKTFVEALEDSDPVVPLARYLLEHHDIIHSIDYILLTDARISTRVKEIKLSEYKIEHAQKCEIWDIQRLYELDSSGRQREPIEVDFTDYAKNGIECLRASTGEVSLQSYLLVLPGQVLANLYDKYGERLFEQNVRTFLQFRGKVNKGIRNTIIQQPSMFFAYNNGLSATGEAVAISADGNRILKITNLQIVNGGQTTASIYTAWRNEKASLKDIFVQVKLSVVEGDKVEDLVPKISEYANTQNKVNAADFFSNHPFHLRIEEFSRRLWAPSVDGSTRQTHWFYERARGQFANAQAKLAPAKAREFLLQNPKRQMFTKTDLAKYCLSFWQKPHLVSRGAQKAFAGTSGRDGFVTLIAKEWDENCDRNGNNISINELWFQEAISKAIIFKSLDRILVDLLRERNFGSYKASIVTYTLAKFAAMLESSGKSLDYKIIWNTQSVPKIILEELVRIAEKITTFFQEQKEHLGEFAKKEACWQMVMELHLDLSESAYEFLQRKEVSQSAKRQAEKDQQMINGIHAQRYIIEKGGAYWEAMLKWNETARKLTDKENGCLSVACKIAIGRVPSEAQSIIIIKAEKRAKAEGFYTEK